MFDGEPESNFFSESTICAVPNNFSATFRNDYGVTCADFFSKPLLLIFQHKRLVAIVGSTVEDASFSFRRLAKHAKFRRFS